MTLFVSRNEADARMLRQIVGQAKRSLIRAADIARARDPPVFVLGLSCAMRISTLVRVGGNCSGRPKPPGSR